MTFPQTPLNLLVELYVNGAWTDITSDVYERDGISITRGKTGDASQAAPSSCQLTLNNRAGKYSPRNPLGPYYGLIGRNTQIRAGLASTALAYTGVAQKVSTPDSVALSITGDIDVRIEIAVNSPNSWASTIDLMSKYGVAGQKSWLFYVLADKKVRFFTWADGTNSISHTSTVALPFITGRVALRATLDANNGAGGHTVTFYTAPSMDGTWTQLGAPVVTAGTTSIFDSTSPVVVGNAFTGSPPSSSVFKAKVLNGIGGTAVASPDFTAQGIGTTPFVDAQGNTWTFAGGAAIVADAMDQLRFTGEVSSFPPRWDTSGNDAWVPIECAGMLRRLGQGSDPAETGLRAFTLASTGLFNYWPLNGARGTTYSLDIGGSNSGSDRYYAWPATTPTGPSFVYGEPLNAFLGTGMALFNDGDYGAMRGDVGTSQSNAYEAVDFVFQSSALGSLTFQVRDYGSNYWAMNLSGPTIFGQAGVVFTDAAGTVTTVGTSAVLPELADGLVHHCRLSLLKNGTGTDWAVFIDGVSVVSGTQAAHNVTGMSSLQTFYARGATESWVVLGHITVWSDTSNSWPTAAACTDAAFGYVGEAAGDRIERICTLADVPIIIDGTASDSMMMGPQYSESTLTQLRDAESTDMGILTEPRHSFGLLYRTHRSLYNQTPVLTIDYDAGQLAPPFEPVDDDQLTANAITAIRREGDSYQLSLDSGALSTQEPPNGVGKYKNEYTANVETDDLLSGIAGWLLHVGTLDEARFPSIKVDLANKNVVAGGISTAALAVDIGDLIKVVDAEPAHIYDDILAIALGYTERLNVYEHTIAFNCAPGSTYSVFAVEDASSRISSGEASTLTSGITSSATSISVTSTTGTLWTTSAGDMPISLMVGGEEVTVSAISGASTPQTFTVARSVNGVVKTHSAGAVVRLKRRAVWAL
jgi:hypothetical protein